MQLQQIPFEVVERFFADINHRLANSTTMSHPKPSQLFTGTFVQVSTRKGGLEVFSSHLLALDSSGVILDFSPVSTSIYQELITARDESVSLVEAPLGSSFLPTFCDLHLHAPQFLYLGTGLHLPLMEWLGAYAYKAEQRLDADASLARKVYATPARRLIQSGTGAALLFGTIKEDTNIILAEEFQKAGLRGFVGKLSMDKNSPPTYTEASASASLTAAESFINRCRHLVSEVPSHPRLIEPVITPRFVPTCSNELLEGLGHLAQRTNTMIQSHMDEARDQVDWVKSERGIEDFEIFDQYGLLTSRTIQAHCTYLPEPLTGSLHTLKDRGTAIAHCPLSNTYFSNKPFPLREVLDADVKVGLGSDVAGGYAIDIMTAMRQAVIMSRTREGTRKETKLAASADLAAAAVPVDGPPSLAVHWTETLYMATRGGAEALGLSTGSFTPGVPFDAQLITLMDGTQMGVGNLDFFDPFDEYTLEEVIEKWWCMGDNANRSGVWIQGQKVL